MKKFFIWMLDKRVLNAINAGASYEEVEQLVTEIMKEDGRR